MKNQILNKNTKWTHPGGKLIELGPDKLSDSELLAILIGAGIKGKSAEQIAEDILRRFKSFRGLAGKSFEKLREIKGLGDVKILRIAAAFEIAKRCVDMITQSLKDDPELRKEIFGE